MVELEQETEQMTKPNHDDQPEKPQGEQERNLDVADLMEQELEEIDTDEEGEPGDSGDDDGGDQSSAEDGAGKPPAAEPPKRKWGGRFESPEEMEAEFIRMSTTTRPPADDKPPASEELPDLTEAEMATLAEQDEADGSQFAREYLSKKMKARNLTTHELKALRKIDTEQGTDLLGDYHELRAARRIQQETAPLVRRSQQEAQQQFQARELKIDESNAKEFGSSLKELEGFCSSPENVNQVLQFSPIAHLIVNEHERGSPATAHKLLLREAQAFQRMNQESTARVKKTKSISADAGGGGSPRKAKDSAATVEEAFEAAEEELDQ
jgi:hypothetical protein